MTAQQGPLQHRGWLAGAIALIGLIVGIDLLVHSNGAVAGLGTLVIAASLLPGGLLLTAAAPRRRPIGGLLILLGVLLAGIGLLWAAPHDFLDLRLSLIDWRIFVTSVTRLAPLGCVALGLAAVLAGVGALTTRSGLTAAASISAGLVACGFGAGVLVGPIWAAVHGYSFWDARAFAVITTLTLSAVGLLAVGVFRRRALPWVVPVGRTVSPTRSRRTRLVTVAGIAVVAVGLAVALGPSPTSMTTLASVFPDANLAACVATSMGKPDANAQVSKSQLSDVRSLTCSGASGDQQIADLAGIERLPNVATLDLPSQRISNLGPVTGLQKLWRLTLTGNQVSDLSGLSDLPVLTSLGLSSNQISDIAPLADLPSVTYLGLAGNRITDLTPLRGLTGLAELDLGRNRIADVSVLSGLGRLDTLSLANNLVSDPAPVSALPVVKLNLSGNVIGDLSSLRAATSVQYLTIGGNKITDLTPLIGLPALIGVDLQGSDPAAITGIDQLRASGVAVGGLAR